MIQQLLWKQKFPVLAMLPLQKKANIAACKLHDQKKLRLQPDFRAPIILLSALYVLPGK